MTPANIIYPNCIEPVLALRDRRAAGWLWIIFAVACVCRAGWGVFRMLRMDDPAALEFPDESQYWQMAEALRAGKGLPDELGFQATRMPLYPAFLALFAGSANGVIIARVAQWLLGALGAVFGACAAQRACNDRRAAWTAGLMMAVDPFLIYFSSLLLTETLFVTALTGLWCLLLQLVRADAPRIRTWLLTGAIAAACVYARESALGLVLPALALAAMAGRRRPNVILGAVLAGLIVFASLTPWAWRNSRVIGSWCWLTTRGGISLYDGVRPGATGESDLGDVKNMPAVQGLSETQWNAYFQREAWRLIREDPARAARLAVRKIARMWNPVPNVESYRSTLLRVVSAGWMMPILILASAGAVLLPMNVQKPRWAILALLLLPAVYLTALHALFVGSVRYRLGAMPMLEILAAYALTTIALRRRRERQNDVEVA